MYYLILVITVVAGGASTTVDYIPFESESACVEARSVIVGNYDSTPAGPMSTKEIEAWCVRQQ